MSIMPDALSVILTELMGRLVERKGFQHAVMEVVSGDGSIAWSGATGAADPEGHPMRADTPFFVASIDKLLMATCILRLSEKRRLDMDAPIADYLPRSVVVGVHRLGGVDHSWDLTLRHLLSHTSGLPDWLIDRPKKGPTLLDRLTSGQDIAISLEEIAEYVRSRLKPHFPPQPPDAKRRRARYSDTNFMLINALIESVTGLPAGRVYEQMLFAPLGMRSTWVFGHTDPMDRTPSPAVFYDGHRPISIPLMIKSIRGVYSTTCDMIRFLRALIGSRVFANPDTLEMMRGHWTRFGFPLDRAALRQPSWPIAYGLGMMRFHDPLLSLIGRLPRGLRPLYPVPAVIGHTGATGTWLFYCPLLDVYLSGSVDDVRAGPVPFRLMYPLLRALEQAGLPRE